MMHSRSDTLQEESPSITLPPWSYWTLPFVLVLAFRLPYFGLTVLNSDEGLYAAVARVMQNGGLPYRDAWDHAAPGIFYVYRFLFGIFGPWSMGAVRLAALVMHFASGMIVGQAVRKKYGSLTGLVTSLLVIAAIGGYLPADSIAGLTETFLLPFFLTAVTLTLLWVDTGRRFSLWTGLAIAVATWFKIHALLIFIIVLVGAVIARRMTGEKSNSDISYPVKILAWAALGYLLLVLPLWIAGGFYDYFRIYIGYNIFYWQVGSYNLIFWEGLLRTAWQWGFPQFLLLILAVTGLIALFNSSLSHERARGVFLLIATSAAILTAVTGARLFGHYFIPSAALIALTAGDGVNYLMEKMKAIEVKPLSAVSFFGAGILLVGLLQPLIYFHGDAYRIRMEIAFHSGYMRIKFPALTEEIRQVVPADKKIWVWGFAPEIYTLAQRDCSSRFINANYLVGLVPWINAAPDIDTTPYIIKGAWSLLQEDLSSSPPAAIIDAAEANYQFWGKYPMRGNPGLMGYVERNYVDAGTYDGFRLYVRKDIGRERYPANEPGDTPVDMTRPGGD